MSFLQTRKYSSDMARALMPASRLPVHSQLTRRQQKACLYNRVVRSKIRLFLREPRSVSFYGKLVISRLFGPKTDLSIVSFPKSGRTWLDQLLVEAIHRHRGLTNETSKTMSELSRRRSDLPVVAFTHAGSSIQEDGVVWDEDEIYTLDVDRLAARRCVFLYRDPRDVLVSFFYHIKNRVGVDDLTADYLIDSPVIGLRKMLRFMNMWYEFTEQHPEHSTRVCYEDLKLDTPHELRKIFALMQVDISVAALSAATEACEFSKMKEKERKSEYKNPRLTPTETPNPDSFKVRSGKTGEHRKFFDSGQLSRINQMIVEELDERFGYHER